MIKKIKETPNIILNTLDAFWVILLSIVANYLISLELNFKWEVERSIVCKLVVLFFCVISYAYPYFKFKKNYNIADEKDKRNLFDYEQGKTEERHRIDYFLWSSFNCRIFWWFLVFLLLMGCFVYHCK